MSAHTKLDWPIVTYPNDSNLTEQGYLMLLNREIQIVNQKFIKNSAVLTIQRNFRGYAIRKIFLGLKMEANY